MRIPTPCSRSSSATHRRTRDPRGWSRDRWMAPRAAARRHDRPRPARGGSRRRAGRARPLRTGERTMTIDLTRRLGELGAVLAARMPGVFDATLALLESVPAALD